MRILIVIISVLSFCSCKKDALITSLPPITNSGQNTLGFTVEDKVWVPKWDNIAWGESGVEINTSYLPFNKNFELSGNLKVHNKKSYFTLHIDNFASTGTYTSNCTITIADPHGMFIQNGGEYNNFCGPNTSCNITITTLDTTNKIISGIFDARLKKVSILSSELQDIYPNSPEYTTIQGGRFDVKYY